MEERNVKLSLEKAREWYQKGGELKEVVLQIYKEEELKTLTYKNICESLFANKSIYSIGNGGSIEQIENNNGCYDYIVHYPNKGTSSHQLKKLLAMNKLVNVAKYLNNGWEPNWDDPREDKNYIYYNSVDKTLETSHTVLSRYATVYFKTPELAKRAIDILGDDCIKLAIAENW